MLESLFNNLQVSRLATLLKTHSNTGVFLWILQTLRTPVSKNICERLVLKVVIYCTENWITLFRKRIGLPDWRMNVSKIEWFSLYFTYFHSYSFVLSLAVIRCHPLSSFVNRCHSLSLVVTCCTAHCRPLSLFVSLVVIRCTTRCHSLYHSLPFVGTRCHSMSLDVPLVCLFINDHYFIIFCFLHHL